GANWKSRYVPLLGAVFFLYVGSEASFGGWIASYAKRAIPGETSWILTPSFFWASLLFGRSIAPALLRRVPEISLSRTSPLVGCFTMLLLHLFIEQQPNRAENKKIAAT